MRRTTIVFACAGAVILAALLPSVRREIVARTGRASVEDRLREVEARVEPIWHARGVNPAHTDGVVLVALKAQRELLVFAVSNGEARHAATYPILAASGGPGPKRREGDRQVPEGVYRIEFLNPNSRFRLSLRVDYPNESDRAAAALEGRELRSLGGDIMIHGGAASVGCVAIGDPAIEEVFWLVARVGKENTEVLLAPGRDPAKFGTASTPAWLIERYSTLHARLRWLDVVRDDSSR